MLPISFLTLAATASSVAVGTSTGTFLAAEILTEIANSIICAGPFADASHAAVLQIQNSAWDIKTDVNMVVEHLSVLLEYYHVVERDCVRFHAVSQQGTIYEQIRLARIEIRHAAGQANVGDFAESARHAAQANKIIDNLHINLLCCGLYNLETYIHEIPNMDFES